MIEIFIRLYLILKDLFEMRLSDDDVAVFVVGVVILDLN